MAGMAPSKPVPWPCVVTRRSAGSLKRLASLIEALPQQSGALLSLHYQHEVCILKYIKLHTFTVSASAELGVFSELLLSPGPLPIKKLTSRSLSQLLPPSACTTNACSSWRQHQRGCAWTFMSQGELKSERGPT